jgi:hypothetical protein
MKSMSTVDFPGGSFSALVFYRGFVYKAFHAQ